MRNWKKLLLLLVYQPGNQLIVIITVPDICTSIGKNSLIGTSCLSWASAMPTMYSSGHFTVSLYSDAGPMNDSNHILSGLCKNRPFLHKCWDVVSTTCPGNITTFVSDFASLYYSVCQIYDSYVHSAKCPLVWLAGKNIAKNEPEAATFILNQLEALAGYLYTEEGPVGFAKGFVWFR